MSIGFILAVVAFYFFKQGLDEDNDYLRLNHGMWHLLIGLSSYFVVSSKSVLIYSAVSPGNSIFIRLHCDILVVATWKKKRKGE
jgi:hypothetical protein